MGGRWAKDEAGTNDHCSCLKCFFAPKPSAQTTKFNAHFQLALPQKTLQLVVPDLGRETILTNSRLLNRVLPLGGS
jgi:hypothetical protein